MIWEVLFVVKSRDLGQYSQGWDGFVGIIPIWSDVLLLFTAIFVWQVKQAMATELSVHSTCSSESLWKSALHGLKKRKWSNHHFSVAILIQLSKDFYQVWKFDTYWHTDF